MLTSSTSCNATVITQIGCRVFVQVIYMYSVSVKLAPSSQLLSTSSLHPVLSPHKEPLHTTSPTIAWQDYRIHHHHHGFNVNHCHWNQLISGNLPINAAWISQRISTPNWTSLFLTILKQLINSFTWCYITYLHELSDFLSKIKKIVLCRFTVSPSAAILRTLSLWKPKWKVKAAWKKVKSNVFHTVFVVFWSTNTVQRMPGHFD